MEIIRFGEFDGNSVLYDFNKNPDHLDAKGNYSLQQSGSTMRHGII